jgi:hypothetical protein
MIARQQTKKVTDDPLSILEDAQSQYKEYAESIGLHKLPGPKNEDNSSHKGRMRILTANTFHLSISDLDKETKGPYAFVE